MRVAGVKKEIFSFVMGANVSDGRSAVVLSSS